MYATLTSYNLSAGAHIMFCFVNDVTIGIFMAMLFLAIFCIMTIGSFMFQKMTSGMGDLPACLMVGSWTTLLTAIFFRLIDCGGSSLSLTSDLALAVCIAMALLSFLFLLFSRDN